MSRLALKNVMCKRYLNPSVSRRIMIKKKRIIQVPIEEELLSRIDATAGVVAESRASFIREACKQGLQSLKTEELDRRYVEGYRTNPEKLHWAETSAKLLSKRLPKEKW